MSVFCVGMIYIPLCLYLYRKRFKIFTRRSWIYIPLCLYLYQANDTIIAELIKFTFHYVYIYMMTVIFFLPWLIYLHSTMFIFICKTIQIFPCRSIIYIPLCLYLYYKQRYRKQMHTYLHSTMFIFIFLRVE